MNAFEVQPYGPRSTQWAPIAVEADRVVFAETWRFELRSSRARVESTCTPDSLAWAREEVRLALPEATEAERSAALQQRHGLDDDGRRRCVVSEDERLERSRTPRLLAFQERVRNVPTGDIVDCREPCPDDQELFERRQAFLDETAFVTVAPPQTLVVYRTRAACEAGALRSTVAFSEEDCRRTPK